MKQDTMNGTMTQDADGIWVPAKPLDMQCEHRWCKSSDGSDYFRKNANKDGGSWDSEPIFLCHKHSIGYAPYFQQPMENKVN